jgi:hypothetical protein
LIEAGGDGPNGDRMLRIEHVQERIGESLNLAVGNVKSRLHHATAALRAALEAEARPLLAEEGLA